MQFMKFFIMVGLGTFLSASGIAQSNPVVVELFTSQGCSSCPAADKNLSEIMKNSKDEGSEVLGLSFHVDYWDYIGWKDPYSSRQFADRQRMYAQRLKLNSIYTPQMIVNGNDEFTGSDKPKAKLAIQEARKRTPAFHITISDLTTLKDKVVFRYSVDAEPQGEQLNVAIVERNVENYVSKGENAGKRLHHDNVVRVFKTICLKQSDEITLAFASIAKNASVILYVQDNQLIVRAVTSKSMKLE